PPFEENPIVAKLLAYDEEARQKLASGVTKLARAVRSTLGPRGRNAVIDKGWGSPTVTKDGVTVAEEIELTDPYENMGAQLGTDGVITVEEGKGFETEVNVVEGMQFDRGYLSPHFVTDPDRQEVVLEDPYILIYEEKITTPRTIIPLLEAIARANRPLLVIAE